MSGVTSTSVVIPVRNGGERERAVADYEGTGEGLDVELELVVVADEPRWGAAVRAGLSKAQGERLCFLNPRATNPAVVRKVLESSLALPDAVVRVNRRSRDTIPQRLGSLLYNLEARRLYGVLAWDVNGTPKSFPRKYAQLLELRRDDELLDLEFTVVCEREGYPVVEVPVAATDAAQTPAATGARVLWRALRDRNDLRAR